MKNGDPTKNQFLLLPYDNYGDVKNGDPTKNQFLFLPYDNPSLLKSLVVCSRHDFLKFLPINSNCWISESSKMC